MSAHMKQNLSVAPIRPRLTVIPGSLNRQAPALSPAIQQPSRHQRVAIRRSRQVSPAQIIRERYSRRSRSGLVRLLQDAAVLALLLLPHILMA